MIGELLRANLALGAAVLAAMLLRKPLRRAFGARAAYALWAAPPLAALAALLPRPQTETVLSPFVAQAQGLAAQAAAPTAASADLALAAWIAGALAAALLMAARQARFMAEVRAGRAGPAVVGVLRSRIVTPADFASRFTPEERAVILSHEAQHLARGDAAANALAAAVQCLCWFNPLVHLGARRMRIDQELACDEAVLAGAPTARRLYAEVLLKTQLARQALPLGCHWPPGSEHPLKERIAMLKSPLPAPARRAAGLALIAALGLGGAAAAWAAQTPADPPLVAQPDWIQRPQAADLVLLYPPKAVAEHVEGRALITCDVDAAGRLAACKVLNEDPAGYGFGDAALGMAKSFQMRPMSRDGRPVAGGVVRIPIMFRLPAEPAT